MALFKYTSTNIVPHLSQCTLRFSPQEEFNDPFDAVPNTEELIKGDAQKQLQAILPEFTADELADPQLAEGVRIAREMIEKKAKALYSRRLVSDLQHFRILCLSKVSPDSPAAALMWGHYAQDPANRNRPHGGLVLEFDDGNPWFASHSGRSDRLIGEVEYRTNRPSIAKDQRGVLLIKSHFWKYEEEVRLVRFVAGNDNELTGPNRTVAAFPPEMLKTIYVGIYARTSLLDEIKAELSKNRALAHVKVRRIGSIHPDDFRFEIGA
jgi:hypothetical protein